VVPVYDGPFGAIVKRLDHDITHVHKEPRSFCLRGHVSILTMSSGMVLLDICLRVGGMHIFPTTVFRSVAPAIMVICRNR